MRAFVVGFVVGLACAILLTAARADAAPEAATYRGAVSVQAATLDQTGMAIQAEHDLGWHRLSLAAAVGGRAAALGDYSSFTIGAGLEARRWIGKRDMVGWFASLRLDTARTTLEYEPDHRRVGTVTTTATTVALGHRFVFFRAVELTPTLGLGVATEGGLGGRLPMSSRAVASVGLTLGWIF